MEQGLCFVEPRAQHGEEHQQASEPETAVHALQMVKTMLSHIATEGVFGV